MQAETEAKRQSKPRHVAPVTGDIHPDALLKLPQIIGGRGVPPLLACGRSRFYELVRQGLLPKPRKVGHASYWRAGDVLEAIRKLGAKQ